MVVESHAEFIKTDVCDMVETIVKEVSAQPPSSLPPDLTHNKTGYAGDFIDDTPAPEGGYKIPEQAKLFPTPFDLVAFFDKTIANGQVTLWPWQMEENERFGNAKPTAQHPYKDCLVASNGSGKDKFIIAPRAVWFIFTKIRSRVIGTTSSGTQLTSQTEPYIKDLCEKINAWFGQEVFIVRQRYIKCILTGSEIRLFATDEAGKAEGYHPIDPGGEMYIFENEAKSIDDDIDRALRRCSGFNYWTKCSSTGQPKGHFYQAAISWAHTRYVTSYDCPHVSQEEIEEDKRLDGEFSAFFRSKHLSQFTSEAGSVVISLDLVNSLIASPPTFIWSSAVIRIGLDLAAGGDENVVCITKGNKVIKEWWFRERDTVIAARRISEFLIAEKIPKIHEHIYADDGGVGHGIIDNLNHLGWTKINRIHNQWPALGNKKQFGNRGAENWYRCKRILEERFFDIRGLSKTTHEQLYNRYYRQSETGGRIFLQSKKEAKGDGHPSPDRADAFILSFTGLTVETFMKDAGLIKSTSADKHIRKRELVAHIQMEEFYDDKITYMNYTKDKVKTRQKAFCHLSKILASRN